ncbi:YfiR family protein [bacterium]|nr:MAG: YfiR family protein [bacterium]
MKFIMSIIDEIIVVSHSLRRGIIAGLLVCTMTSYGASQENRNTYGIHKIQAAFIYNFIDFVKWPDHLNKNSGGQITIGILGSDNFGNAFDEVDGTTVHGKTLKIQKSGRLEELLNCWILFVASSESRQLENILKSVAGKPILTVSDMEEFTRRGGMIQFYPVEINGEVKVRFDVNKQRADQSGLTISYQLLSLARPRP